MARVFLSSTQDLEDYRTAAIRILENLGHVPITEEDIWSPSSHEAVAENIAYALVQAAIFVFLIAHRHDEPLPQGATRNRIEFESSVFSKRPGTCLRSW